MATEVANGAPAATANGSALPATVEREDMGGFKLKFCTVCASNQNR